MNWHFRHTDSYLPHDNFKNWLVTGQKETEQSASSVNSKLTTLGLFFVENKNGTKAGIG